jgi:hypothetical protein
LISLGINYWKVIAELYKIIYHFVKNVLDLLGNPFGNSSKKPYIGYIHLDLKKAPNFREISTVHLCNISLGLGLFIRGGLNTIDIGFKVSDQSPIGSQL